MLCVRRSAETRSLKTEEKIMETINVMAMVAGAAFMVLASPFVVAHVAETWDAEEYPYTGFCPDCPEWSDNTLPPVQESVEGGAR